MWDDNLRFLRKMPSVLFALLVMLLTCLFHFRSLDIVIPSICSKLLQHRNSKLSSLALSVGPYVISCQMFVKSEFPLDSALVSDSD